MVQCATANLSAERRIGRRLDKANPAFGDYFAVQLADRKTFLRRILRSQIWFVGSFLRIF